MGTKLTLKPLIGLLALSGCGVEAGNPGGKSEGSGTKKGTLSILIAKEPKSGAEQLTLGLDQLQLLGQKSEDAVQVLTPKLSEINFFADQDKTDDSSQEISSGEVSVGDYQQVMFKLKADKTPEYADKEGKKRKVRWEDPEAKGFAVVSNFSVVEGQKTEILLSLNMYQSIQKGDDHDESVIFKPRGDFKRREGGQKISGPLPTAGVEWVCAYLYGAQPKPPALEATERFDHQGSQKPVFLKDKEKGKDPKGVHEHRGPRLEDRMVYSSRDQIAFDTEYPCKNAFEQAPIKGEEYRLRPVPPGTYAIRFFKVDKTFVDLEKDLVVGTP